MSPGPGLGEGHLHDRSGPRPFTLWDMAAGVLGSEAVAGDGRVWLLSSPLGLLRTVLPALMIGVLGAQGLVLVEDQQRHVALWLLLLQCVPLLVRPRFPRSVLGVAVAAAMVQVLLGMPATNATLGQAVALVTVVVRTGWPSSLVLPAVVLVLNVAAAWMGGLPALGHHALIMGASLAVAWAIGDATGQRVAAAEAVETELAVRTATAQWRSQLAASQERLRIAEELHRLVGEALDAIVVQAGAARLRATGARERLVTIESIARDVLSALDRFLGLLRRDDGDPAPTAREASAQPVALSAGHRLPPEWVSVARALGVLGPVVVLLTLAGIENFGVPAAQRPGAAGVVLLTVAATVPLVWRGSWPLFVAAAVCAASAVQLLIGMPVGNGVLAVAVAAHAVAVHHGWKRGAAWGLGSTVVLLALDARLDPADALELGVVVTVMVLGAVYIGDATRVAREHDASLQARIAAVETEAQLRERAAVAAERTQAARDLHDSIGHTMSLIVLQSGAARLTVSADANGVSERTAGALTSIEHAARSALEALDDTVDLVVAPTEPFPRLTVPASDLSGLVTGVRAAGTAVEVLEDDTADLPSAVRTAVFRIVQEALTNVLKHAPGATVTVSVRRGPGDVEVRVVNTAARAPEEELPSGSRGVTGMQERAARLGGELSAGPDGHGGFAVRAVLPVDGRVRQVHPELRTAEGTS